MTRMPVTHTASDFAIAIKLDQAPAEPPLLVIEPRSGWQVVNLQELWVYRELLYFLAWRDIKVRYKQTFLGVAWAVLQPLATMVVFSLFLGRLAGASSTHLPYPVFVLAGLVPWTFFSNAVVSSSQSILASQSVVTKVYFPRLLIPVGTVVASLADFVIGGALLLGMVLIYGVTPGWSLFLAPLAVLMLVCAALGVGTLFAALTVAYRDFRHLVGFVVQLWMFATPSIYMNVDAQVSSRWRPLLALNPAEGLIGALRSLLFGGELDGAALAVSSGVSLTLLVAGVLYFRRVERHFADIV